MTSFSLQVTTHWTAELKVPDREEGTRQGYVSRPLLVPGQAAGGSSIHTAASFCRDLCSSPVTADSGHLGPTLSWVTSGQTETNTLHSSLASLL